jgi:hypothetical protein
VTTLETIRRRAIEHALELKDGNVPAAAALLDIGRSTVWRLLRHWQAQDAQIIEATARGVGVTEDEVLCVLGKITADDLGERAGYGRAMAYRRADEARRLLKRRRVPWGLALLERDDEDFPDDPGVPAADELRASLP